MNPYIDVVGQGQPMILVHGSFATTSTWKGMVRQLAEHHRCILVKLPGHGGSPDITDTSNANVETELAIIEQAWRELANGEAVHLVGHSFGGVVALALALKGSIPIRQLTLFEPVAAWLLPQVEDHFAYQQVMDFVAGYQDALERNEPRVAGRVVDFWGAQGSFATLPEHIQDSLAPLIPHNLRHWKICQNVPWGVREIRQLAMPVQLICGGDSNPVTHRIAEHIARIAPNGSKQQIAGASHMLVTSHASECVAAMMAD